MEQEKPLDCLCIKSIDYKENDKLITLYAFGEGKITASLKGVKKPKAKLKFAGTLLCFGKYYFTGRNGFYSVIGCDLVDNFYGIWTDIDKYYTALCTLEILDKVAEDREIGDKLALITLKFLNEICYKSENIFLSFAIFLNKTIKILGYNLSPYCINCGEENLHNVYYSFVRSALVCEDCKDSTSLRLSNELADFVKILNSDDVTSGIDLSQEELLTLIKIFFNIICKNLAKKFKTFEEYNLFYNKINECN